MCDVCIMLVAFDVAMVRWELKASNQRIYIYIYIYTSNCFVRIAAFLKASHPLRCGSFLSQPQWHQSREASSTLMLATWLQGLLLYLLLAPLLHRQHPLSVLSLKLARRHRLISSLRWWRTTRQAIKSINARRQRKSRIKKDLRKAVLVLTRSSLALLVLLDTFLHRKGHLQFALIRWNSSSVSRGSRCLRRMIRKGTSKISMVALNRKPWQILGSAPTTTAAAAAAAAALATGVIRNICIG